MSPRAKQQAPQQNFLSLTVTPPGGKKYHKLCKTFSVVRKSSTWKAQEVYYCEKCKLEIYPAWETKCIDFNKIQKGKRK